MKQAKEIKIVDLENRREHSMFHRVPYQTA